MNQKKSQQRHGRYFSMMPSIALLILWVKRLRVCILTALRIGFRVLDVKCLAERFTLVVSDRARTGDPQFFYSCPSRAFRLHRESRSYRDVFSRIHPVEQG